MARQFNNKYLLVIFGVLLGLFGLSKLLDSGKTVRNFRSELTSFDSSKVSSILIYPALEQGKEIRLERSGNRWHVIRDDFRAEADPAAVANALPQLMNLPVKRLAATSKDKWADFEVTDSAGTRVKVMEGKNTLADIVIGKFNVNQQLRTFTTFARVTDEDEVYALDAFLGMTFNRDLNSWRNKTFVKLNKGDITKISFSGSDQNFGFQKLGADWSSGSNTIDSTAMDQYLSGLANLNGTEFANNFTESAPETTISIEGNNMTPITVKRFPGGDGKFVFQSSLNPNAYFVSDSTGIYDKLEKALPGFGSE